MAAILFGTLLTIAGAIFAAMMSVSQSTAAANLKTYWTSLGLSAGMGGFLGLSALIAGLILMVIGRKRFGRQREGRTAGVLIEGGSENRVSDVRTHNMDIGVGVKDSPETVVRDVTASRDRRS